MYKITKDNSKFAKVKGKISDKSFLEDLQDDLSIGHEIHHFFLTKPTFEKYNEVDETYRKVIKFSSPSEEEWDKFLGLIE